jgi:hypothetical protein
MGKIGLVLQAVTVELVVLDQLVADHWRAESRRCFHRHCGAIDFDRLNYRGIRGSSRLCTAGHQNEHKMGYDNRFSLPI